MRRTLVLFSTLAAACLPMLAQDATLPTSEFHGYFRAGSGRSSQGGEQVPFGLPGYSKFRLGNETDNYGELEWDAKVYEKDGATFNVHTMANFDNPYSSGVGDQGTGSSVTGLSGKDFEMAQYWAEGKGIMGNSDAFKDASLWIGKRYYNRNNIEILDYFYWNNQGNGGGIENVNLGWGKFAYAYMQNDSAISAEQLAANDVVPITRNVVGSHDFRISDIPANQDGHFMVGVEIQEASPYTGANGVKNNGGMNHGGVTFDVMHIQDKVWGGWNKFTVQYGTGASAGTVNANSAGPGNSILDNSPAAGAANGNKAYRVVELLHIQPTTNFGLQFAALYQNAKDNNTGLKSTWYAIGARPQLYLTPHFSIALDGGNTTVKTDTMASASLNKETLAFMWSPTTDWYSRPSIRLFMTSAQWNQAANAMSLAATSSAAVPASTYSLGAPANPGVTMADGVFQNKTSGTTYGIQVEAWW